MDPGDYPDDRALTIATEVSANESMPEPLPGAPIRLEGFPQLKPNEDTETRYARLAKPSPRSKDNGGRKSSGGGTSAESGPDIQTLDDHSQWQTIREQASFARDLIEVAISASLAGEDDLSDEEAREVKEACENWGLDAAAMIARLEPSLRDQSVDWRRLLRRHVGRELDRSPTYSRPPRRFPHLIGVVPGTLMRAGKPRVMAVADTSGSMGKEILADISGELTRMARGREVTVVECDAAIHNVYRYRHPLEQVMGRGGTDFHPPLEPAFLRQHRPDLVIFFTDGFGPAPDHPPRVPVIWVLTPDGIPPAEWGKVVRMG